MTMLAKVVGLKSSSYEGLSKSPIQKLFEDLRNYYFGELFGKKTLSFSSKWEKLLRSMITFSHQQRMDADKVYECLEGNYLSLKERIILI